MRQPRYGDIFAGHDEGAALAEIARVLWAEYSANLERRGLWSDARGRTLDRLVRATVEYQHLYPVAASQGPVNVAANGNEFFNYRWAAVHKLSDQIAKLEKALMLTPESMRERNADDRGLSIPKAPADEFLGDH